MEQAEGTELLDILCIVYQKCFLYRVLRTSFGSNECGNVVDGFGSSKVRRFVK